ncbi:hypothetical protein [Afipia felis]|uniref:hypothetical protein n=1 Tax=Afipia felis TaxID=1035 RepID=UPI0011C071BC|nr:hypothetical protein [Afipia felis]
MRRDIATWAVRFSHVRLARAASTASRPAHRDDRETPLNHGAGQAHHKRGWATGDKDVRRFFVKRRRRVQKLKDLPGMIATPAISALRKTIETELSTKNMISKLQI